jgi:hypothetical protein
LFINILEILPILYEAQAIFAFSKMEKERNENYRKPPLRAAKIVNSTHLVSCSKNVVSSETVTSLLEGLEDMIKADSSDAGWEKIFLDDSPILDEFRLQRKFSTLPKKLKLLCNEIHADMKMRLRDRYGGDYILSSGNILWSKPGGQQQAFHADFSPNLANKLDNPPVVFFLAISHASKLDIAFRLVSANDVLAERDIHRQRIISQGSLLEFHGGLPHAGCPYSTNNFRFHWYAKSRGTGITPSKWTYIFERVEPNKKKRVTESDRVDGDGYLYY